ncbi:MAG: SufD family Fe-S cluster assembly protein [Pseudomonadota bacterium]
MHELDNPDKKKGSNISAVVDLKQYSTPQESHHYLNKLSDMSGADMDRMLKVGVDTSEKDRSATFIQQDISVVHCSSNQEGLEIMGVSEAAKRYGWLDQYMWKSIDPGKDEFTQRAHTSPSEGYFIRVLPGVRIDRPIQSCLYLAQQGASQNVHNIVIVEEGAELHLITGCTTAPHVLSGLHIGVSEFFVKKGGKLTFTMIHNWGKDVAVRPRSAAYVEEGGVIISNFVSLKPLRTLQMYPVTWLVGAGAVARFNSVLVAPVGTHMDIGSKVVLDAPGARAEIISRAITTGGTIIARGNLTGKRPGVKGHLECKGLILSDGIIHAIPELEGHVSGVEMSHEAAVGKIAQEEIEYLMARGLDEQEAISTIVRGFLSVDIEGLPASLKREIETAITESEKEMF